MEIQKQKIEIGVTAFILAATVYLQYVAYTTKVRTNVQGMDSMAFPKILFYLQIALCVGLLVKGFIHLRRLTAAQKAEASEEAETPAKKTAFIDRRVVISVILILCYALCWEWIGFSLSSMLFFMAECMVLDHSRPWWHALLIAVGYTVLVYAIFKLGFGVALPEPIFELLGW